MSDSVSPMVNLLNMGTEGGPNSPISRNDSEENSGKGGGGGSQNGRPQTQATIHTATTILSTTTDASGEVGEMEEAPTAKSTGKEAKKSANWRGYYALGRHNWTIGPDYSYKLQ